jgi:CRISPR-associated protein Cas5t
MSELRLYIQAPFAAARPFVAGWYRPTASFLTPSATYGLLLNIAGIEMRLWEHEREPDGTPASLVRPTGLPNLHLAIGLPAGSDPPVIQTLYQQLHNYPVGSTVAIPETWAKGRKNNIQPVRREMLSDVRVVVAAKGEDNVIEGIRAGLDGRTSRIYGLPFLGDNNFLIDRIEEVGPDYSARWYERVPDASGHPREGTTRLTVWIDRALMCKTVSYLYAPTEAATIEPPRNAWTLIPMKETEREVETAPTTPAPYPERNLAECDLAPPPIERMPQIRPPD